MTLDLNLAHLIAFGVAFVSALWALMKVIAAQQEKALETRFTGLATTMTSIHAGMAKQQEIAQHQERELLQFKAEVARDRVHREDFIRAVGTIETKIDNMSLRMERAMLTNRSGGQT